LARHLNSVGHHSRKPRLKLVVSAGKAQTNNILHLSFIVESSNMSEMQLILMQVSFKVGSQAGVPA